MIQHKNTFLTRREILEKGLLFSAGLMLPQVLWAEDGFPGFTGDNLHLFCFGDWGCGAPSQAAVAKSMQDYASKLGITPQALILLGDNFYGPLPGTDSPRWQKEFEDMYPSTAFPGPCYAVLGNHDYDDQPGGEKIQMDYANKPGTRWKMPNRWYRLELPADKPVLTLLCVDSHYAKLSKGDIAAQEQWLIDQLEAPRTTPWLMVCGHHPVLSCGLYHGDTVGLQHWRELFCKYKVDAYLCGHEHDLQLLHEPGQPTDWIVSGGGGKTLYPIGKPEKAEFAQETFGFLHLALTKENWTGTFVGTAATPLYSFTRKHPA